MADSGDENDVLAGRNEGTDKERNNIKVKDKKQTAGEHGGKSRRGRPMKKEKEEKVEAVGMKNFLETGKITSYELEFGG